MTPTRHEPPLSAAERRALVRRWNQGEPLESLARAAGRSVFAIGGALLSTPQPAPQGA